MKKPLLVLFALLAACGDDDSSSSPPADVSGNYSVSVTNTDNGCGYNGWTIGQSTQNIAFVVTQNGVAASGEVKGAANFYFAVLGIGPLAGTVDGAHANMAADGTLHLKDGNCDYVVRATADFTLTGDTINGTMTYSNTTNGDPSCGTKSTCTSTQSIAGSRPPK
jgi:hypothetical protein